MDAPDALEAPDVHGVVANKSAQNELENDEEAQGDAPTSTAAAQPVHFSEERVAEIGVRLMENGLSTRGSDNVLVARWLSFEKGRNPNRSSAVYYDLQYLVVVDFEATCKEDGQAGSYLQEIIEFPALLIDVRKKMIVSEFHAYCRPTAEKVISEYCTNLTGITQEMVDASQDFPSVLLRFHAWLRDHGLMKRTKWTIVADGSFDLKLFLKTSCEMNRIAYPCYARTFVNLPFLFHWIYLHSDQTKRRNNLSGMLEELGLEFEGRLHSGMDDARNIARICLIMIEDGVYFRPTEVVKVGEVDRLRPLCCRTFPMGKSTWEKIHKAVMKKLPALEDKVNQQLRR